VAYQAAFTKDAKESDVVGDSMRHAALAMDAATFRALGHRLDGAYGGFAAAVPEAPDDLRALSHTDSVAVDPHKWLYAPLAVIAGRYALRACIVNFHTARPDVEALPEIVARVGRKVDAELRTTS
jgi:hypothetical protein